MCGRRNNIVIVQLLNCKSSLLHYQHNTFRLLTLIPLHTSIEEAVTGRDPSHYIFQTDRLLVRIIRNNQKSHFEFLMTHSLWKLTESIWFGIYTFTCLFYKFFFLFIFFFVLLFFFFFIHSFFLSFVFVSSKLRCGTETSTFERTYLFLISPLRKSTFELFSYGLKNAN